MSVNAPNLTSNQRLKYIVSTLSDYRLVWLVPAIAAMVLSVVYVMVLKNDTWTARQSLVVRDDLLGQSFKPGRFESLESMKSAQETILEIAREPQVIRNALEKLGPESTGIFGAGNWPSEKVIEQMQGAITLSAPNGAELGKTEVIVLNVKGATRERARKLITLLLDEIRIKASEVRQMRMQSMVMEMEQARNASKQVLDDSKARLRAMDKEFGGDIGSMGTYDQGGSANLQKDISQIQMEKRIVDSDIGSAEKVLDILVSASQDSDVIVNISGDMLKFQPSLEVLKQALVTAQKELTVAKGTYTLEHPKVESATESVAAMRIMIFNELASSVGSLEKEIATLRSKSVRLENEKVLLEDRLSRVSSGRVDALTLLADVKKRTEMVNKAETQLQEIRVLASSATSFDLMTVVDIPQVPTSPDGLGKKPLVMAGSLGGLMLGLGLVMLTAPPMEDHANLVSRTPANPELATNPSPARNRVAQPSAKPERSSNQSPDRPITPPAPALAKPVPPMPVTPQAQTVPVRTEKAGSQLDAKVEAKAKVEAPAEMTAQNIARQAFATEAASKPKRPMPISIPRQRQLPAKGALPKNSIKDSAAGVSQISKVVNTVPAQSSSEATRTEPSFTTAPSKPPVSGSPKELQTLQQKAEEALKSLNSDFEEKEIRKAVQTRVPDQTIVIEPLATVGKQKSPSEKTESEIGLEKKGNRPVTSAMVDRAMESIQESHQEAADELAELGSETDELAKHQALFRPVDLAKLAEAEDGIEGVSEVEEAISPPDRRRVNPFLHKRDEANIEKARQEKLDAADPASPVPDQIKKLSQAISQFANPLELTEQTPKGQF